MASFLKSFIVQEALTFEIAIEHRKRCPSCYAGLTSVRKVLVNTAVVEQNEVGVVLILSPSSSYLRLIVIALLYHLKEITTGYTVFHRARQNSGHI